MPYKFNETSRRKIPKAKCQVTNWPQYDAALVRRGSPTVWITEEAVAAWQAPPAAQLTTSAAEVAMIRLCLNQMALHRRKHQLSLCQRQSDHPRRVFGHSGGATDLMNASGPIRSNQLQHDPPLHPAIPVPTTGVR
jgi:hypothetical protein